MKGITKMIHTLLDSIQMLIDSAEMNMDRNQYRVSKPVFDKVSIQIDSIKSIESPTVIPHCPFCFEPMTFTEPSINQSNESIKQHCHCPDCDVMVYIHHFI
jgi:hypothetical protein